MNKKVEERNIFNAIYEGRFKQSITETESPDFIVDDISGVRTGIEITDVIPTPEARLKNQKDYLDNLLTKNGKVFRDDKKIISTGYLKDIKTATLHKSASSLSVSFE